MGVVCYTAYANEAKRKTKAKEKEKLKEAVAMNVRKWGQLPITCTDVCLPFASFVCSHLTQLGLAWLIFFILLFFVGREKI